MSSILPNCARSLRLRCDRLRNVTNEQVSGLDTSVAHPARVYDYWLGGKDNFAADREAAERVLAVTPGLRQRVQANRAFLARAVRYLATEAGIRQFLDIGTGIPS
ncbi:MAG: SAM-dependent methyltransferase, partial [Actinobacteria bacterium]|nr:SAM-dependent methyltransferase [Actinomycetota bacterium]